MQNPKHVLLQKCPNITAQRTILLPQTLRANFQYRALINEHGVVVISKMGQGDSCPINNANDVLQQIESKIDSVRI